MISWWWGGDLSSAGTLVWTSPDWAVVVAAVVALAAWAGAALGSRPVASRTAELACWGLALVGLVIAIAGPVWVEEEGRACRARSSWSCSSMRSRSMDLTLEAGEPTL